LDGVSRLGLIFGSHVRRCGEGGAVEGVMNDGPAIGTKCVVGESSSVVGGRLPIAAITAQTGLGCRRGNVPFVDVGKLGFICVSAMASGLNGQTPVADLGEWATALHGRILVPV
jgi:hypothetical protein